MNKITKSLVAFAIAATCGSFALAAELESHGKPLFANASSLGNSSSSILVTQDNNDSDGNMEEREFAPIHATLNPGTSPLNFEEVYNKNASLYTNGDALFIKVGKFNTVTSNAVVLPINAYEDYTLEYTFKFKADKGVITIASNNYAIAFGMNTVIITTLVNNSSDQETFKKWKIPQGKEKGYVVCKIVKSKNIVSFFLNDKFVTEISVNPKSSDYLLAIAASGLKLEAELQSVQINQGAETEE